MLIVIWILTPFAPPDPITCTHNSAQVHQDRSSAQQRTAQLAWPNSPIGFLHRESLLGCLLAVSHEPRVPCLLVELVVSSSAWPRLPVPDGHAEKALVVVGQQASSGKEEPWLQAAATRFLLSLAGRSQAESTILMIAKVILDRSQMHLFGWNCASVQTPLPSTPDGYLIRPSSSKLAPRALFLKPPRFPAPENQDKGVTVEFYH